MSEVEYLISRKRQRTLLIVEGHHEKEKLFKLLIKCFPEININYEDILIFGTNVYNLYQYIVDEYDDDWDDGNYDVDLPRIVSKKLDLSPLLNKRDFTDIILIFDYERHDPNFSEDRLFRMQSFFSESSEEGKLYINYPMIESYQDFDGFPDLGFVDKIISVSIHPGWQYKNMTKDKFIAKLVNLPQKMFEIINQRFHVSDEQTCRICVERILKINNPTDMETQIRSILKAAFCDSTIETAIHQMAFLIRDAGYAVDGTTFYEHMRQVFNQIILHNIRKANKLQNGIYDIGKEAYNAVFHDLAWTTILDVQNCASRDVERGIVWILNTCVTFVPEYNFKLLDI